MNFFFFSLKEIQNDDQGIWIILIEVRLVFLFYYFFSIFAIECVLQLYLNNLDSILFPCRDEIEFIIGNIHNAVLEIYDWSLFIDTHHVERDGLLRRILTHDAWLCVDIPSRYICIRLTTYPFEAFNTTVLLELIEDSRYFWALTS